LRSEGEEEIVGGAEKGGTAQNRRGEEVLNVKFIIEVHSSATYPPTRQAENKGRNKSDAEG